MITGQRRVVVVVALGCACSPHAQPGSAPAHDERRPALSVSATAAPPPVVGPVAAEPTAGMSRQKCQAICQRAAVCKLETFWGVAACIDHCTTENWAVFTCLEGAGRCDLIAACLDP